MSENISGGEVVAAFLENCGIHAAFGVVSIHNLPILDAIGRRGRVRFVPSRGEAGAVNMADGYARASRGLGAAITSTGTGAGNCAGALVEAMSAGTPLLHITGQVDSPYLDRDCGWIHEARDQLGMLKAVSKAAIRARSSAEIAGALRWASQVALTPPTGPVSVEIAIDAQYGITPTPPDLEVPPIAAPHPSLAAMESLADLASRARRPLLWLGGGARHAGNVVARLVNMGFGVVTSVNGRGTFPEDSPVSLGALHSQNATERLYATCDLIIVVGSRLRSTETRGYTLKLPRPLVMINADAALQAKVYQPDRFIVADATLALDTLADRLEGRMKVDPSFAADLSRTKKQAITEAEEALGPYAEICRDLRRLLPKDSLWVRDITLANSLWGNRLFPLYDAYQGIHAVGGGIGQGLQMAIGAAIAVGSNRKVAALCGDGGLMLNVGELATLAQEAPNILLIVMNDRGYGVIRNIQDARFEGRKRYVNLKTPNFTELAQIFGVPAWNVSNAAEFRTAIGTAMDVSGPALVEVDMSAIGSYDTTFAGSPIGALSAIR